MYTDVWSIYYGGQNHKCLTAIDSSTRWVEVTPIRTESAEDISKAFFCMWIARFGVPATLVTDRGSAFTSEVFNKWCGLLGVRHVRTSPHHPTGNALIESFHRNLNKAFTRNVISQDPPLAFNEVLALALLGYRSMIHPAVGDSPAFLTHGVDPRPALENDWRGLTRWPERERVRNLNLIRWGIMAQAHEQESKVTTDIAPRHRFELGDLVLLKMFPSDAQEVQMTENGGKIRPKWSLPYRVVKISADQQTAVVRNLITYKSRKAQLRDLHIDNARFIRAADTELQRKAWEQEIIASSALKDVMDGECREKLLEDFWEQVDEPPGNKRRRI